MSVPTVAEVVRQLSCLATVRGAADAAELRSALPILDRLSPSAAAELTRGGPAPSPNHHGLSAAIVGRLRELGLRGEHAVLEAARQRIPVLLRRLLDLGAITHDHAATLARDRAIATMADFQAAIADGTIQRVFGATAGHVTQAAQTLAQELRPVPLGRACDILARVQALIVDHCPAIEETVIAGDARRFEPLVGSLVLVARTLDRAAALSALAAAPGVEDVLHRSGRRVILSVQQTEIDVRLSGPDDHGTVLFAATGAGPHVQAVAARRRLALSPREADVYRHAGLPWIPPELRSGTGEIAAAGAGPLPTLVERRDIRGDLHMHSTYSDGQDTIETMLAAAVASGHEYVAMTDHSERAAASRTLTLDQLARQGEEIERLRERFPQIVILHGIEVDVLPDGRLDFDDAVLERLDIVLASLHDAARQDGPALTRRCLQAIRHPLVNVITHPANQLVGRRPGYPMDFDAIYAAAAETGTALEIDGAPSHLDLDGEHARAAVAAGATVTIDSDCHRAALLERQMLLGIGTARRGWVQPHHVLNARPIGEVRAFVAAKRSGSPRNRPARRC